MRSCFGIFVFVTTCEALIAPFCAPAPRRGPPQPLRAVVDDDDDLPALDAAASAAGARANAEGFVDGAGVGAAPPPASLDDVLDADLWRTIEAAKIVADGGSAYPRGRVVNAARADAAAARKRGVLDLDRAGQLLWAQDEDRVVVFLPPLADGLKPRDVAIDFSTRSLTVSVGEHDVLARAPLRHDVDADACAWTVEEVGVVVELPKLRDDLVWASLLDGRSDETLAEELESAYDHSPGDDDGA